jgi:histidinol phosphatase-like PHP family hydrolase
VKFKTEPHLHVSEISPCAKIGAEETIRLYSEAGYKTVFVSDHLKKEFYDKLGDIPWGEKTDKFLYGYFLALEAGKKYGVNVLLSAEFQLNDSQNHFLLYGISKSFLDKLEDVFDMSVPEFYKFAKENGVTVVQAHPYRDGKTTPVGPEYVDAVEVVNSNPRHENYSEKTIAYAKEHGIPMTGGSDTHRQEDVALGGVISEYEIKTASDYIDLILDNKAEIIRGA